MRDRGERKVEAAQSERALQLERPEPAVAVRIDGVKPLSALRGGGLVVVIVGVMLCVRLFGVWYAHATARRIRAACVATPTPNALRHDDFTVLCVLPHLPHLLDRRHRRRHFAVAAAVAAAAGAPAAARASVSFRLSAPLLHLTGKLLDVYASKSLYSLID